MPDLPDLHTQADDVRFLAEKVLPRQRVVVALEEGRQAGFIACAPGWVHLLYVDPAWHRRGLGSRLLAEADRLAAGTDALRLWCFQSNRVAQRFYEARGFVVERLTDGSGNEERLPDILYRRPFGGVAYPAAHRSDATQAPPHDQEEPPP